MENQQHIQLHGAAQSLMALAARPENAGMSEPDPRLLAAVHETARHLHRAGVIGKRHMARYDALCLPPAPASRQGKENAPGPRAEAKPI